MRGRILIFTKPVFEKNRLCKKLPPAAALLFDPPGGDLGRLTPLVDQVQVWQVYILFFIGSPVDFKCFYDFLDRAVVYAVVVGDKTFIPVQDLIGINDVEPI